MKVAPHSVSGRVVKTSIGSPCLGLEDDRWRLRERPIQLVCRMLHALGPVHAVVVQQFVGILGGAEEPLLQVLLDDRRAAALAVAVIAPDLLARQGGVAVRAEIHRRHFAVGQPVLVELDEEPLGPFVIFRVAGDGLAPPVEHGAHRAHLLAHVLDILVGPLHRDGCRRLMAAFSAGRPKASKPIGNSTL